MLDFSALLPMPLFYTVHEDPKDPASSTSSFDLDMFSLTQ